ncbi:MAG: hypothetical protein PHH67_00055 [Methanosarcina sp.]|jgi:hypothetical protein|nr:hypothetical protein [Methanosarcina sp.]MDD3317542.1 hypothetical protein [Methanosarcina sp.]MDD4304900.1 hypothetical protein [Methanosarcina sp.]MDD4619760.1 hypothetical protein [Methanosarcina sp.]
MITKRFVIGTLFLVIFLVGMAFVPTASAIDTKLSEEKSTKSIYCAENEIISKLSSNQTSSENSKKAEELINKIKAQNEQEISDSVNKSTSEQISILSTVTLGTDATFTNADCGDSGTSSWGAAPCLKGSDYIKSSRRAREAVLTGPGGYGGGGAWAWVGKSFYVSGSGSQSANIRMTGYLYGLTSAAAGGSSSSDVDLVLKDSTTGTSYSTSIYSVSCGGLGWENVDQSFNKGLSVTLQGGHSYIAYLKVAGSASTYGIGEAGSDFGPGDGDDEGYVSYSSIIVDF